MNRRAAGILLSIGLSSALVRLGVACSEFESAPDPTTDAAATDAPASQSDAPSPDANGGDAGGDAPVSSSLCTGAEHFLCADFNAEPYTRGWTEEARTDGGTFALDPSTAVSPPSSLSANVAPLTQDGTSAMLMKRMAVTPREVTLTFALRVDQTASAGANVAAIELGNVPGGDGAYFLISGTALEAQISVEVVVRVDGSLQRSESIVPSGVPIGQWRTYTMILSLADGGPAGTVKLLVDGQLAIESPVNLGSPTPGARASVGLSHYSNVFPEHRVHIDDVVLDVVQ